VVTLSALPYPLCLLLQLLNPAISESCPTPFDEGRLWKGENAAELKAQLQATFQNITRIMDCVGCEKCKLWGKLQTLGAHPDATSAPNHNPSRPRHVMRQGMQIIKALCGVCVRHSGLCWYGRRGRHGHVLQGSEGN
jgi:hypothetical protein